MEKFCITMPIEGEYLTTVRLTVGGLCALVGLDVDSAEDYKVCVTESLLLLKRGGYTEAEIEFGIGDTLAFRVSGANRTGDVQDSIEDGISRALLTALLGEIRFIDDDEGRLERVVFEG